MSCDLGETEEEFDKRLEAYMMEESHENKISRNYLLHSLCLMDCFICHCADLAVLYYSLFDIEGNFSLINYQKFFTPVYLKMTLSSFWYAFLITGISFLVAYPTAYLLTKTKHKQLWLLLIIVPSWINLLLKAYAFIGIFGTYGVANGFLEAIGIGKQQILFTDFSFIFVSVYIFIPFMILPIFNAFDKMNPTLNGCGSMI